MSSSVGRRAIRPSCLHQYDTGGVENPRTPGGARGRHRDEGNRRECHGTADGERPLGGTFSAVEGSPRRRGRVLRG